MGEIQRYDLEAAMNRGVTEYVEVLKSALGEWVKYEDHQAALATARREAIEYAIEFFVDHDAVDTCCAEIGRMLQEDEAKDVRALIEPAEGGEGEGK